MIRHFPGSRHNGSSILSDRISCTHGGKPVSTIEQLQLSEKARLFKQKQTSITLKANILLLATRMCVKNNGTLVIPISITP